MRDCRTTFVLRLKGSSPCKYSMTGLLLLVLHVFVDRYAQLLTFYSYDYDVESPSEYKVAKQWTSVLSQHFIDTIA